MSSLDLKATAQVACEAVVNAPHGYDRATVEEVHRVAVSVGVAPLYVRLVGALLGEGVEDCGCGAPRLLDGCCAAHPTCEVL